jgi:hypothetical protein
LRWRANEAARLDKAPLAASYLSIHDLTSPIIALCDISLDAITKICALLCE